MLELPKLGNWGRERNGDKFYEYADFVVGPTILCCRYVAGTKWEAEFVVPVCYRLEMG